jgi:hypothetical protein
MRKEPQEFDSPLAHDYNLINRIMKQKEIPIVDANGKVLFNCVKDGDNLTVGEAFVKPIEEKKHTSANASTSKRSPGTR